MHRLVKPRSRTVRACAVRYRPRPLTDRMTAAARWHFILRQWFTIKPIHLTALAAAAALWRVSLQAGSIPNDQTDRYRPKIRVGCRWPHRARFHVLCLVTWSTARWSGRCLLFNECHVTIRGAVFISVIMHKIRLLRNVNMFRIEKLHLKLTTLYIVWWRSHRNSECLLISVMHFLLDLCSSF